MSMTRILRVAAVCMLFATLATAFVWYKRTHTKASSTVSILVALTLVLATAQAPDRLRLNAKEYFLHTNPLETYLEKNPNARPQSDWMSTHNWRGYSASWEIREDRLVLVDVEVLGSKSEPGKSESKAGLPELRSVLPSVFPHQKEVFADWFSGHLVVPQGEPVEYV